MTQKHKDAIRNGISRSLKHRRLSKAMKESWARRRFDSEMSKPKAAIDMVNESVGFRKTLASFDKLVEPKPETMKEYISRVSSREVDQFTNDVGQHIVDEVIELRKQNNWYRELFTKLQQTLND